MRAIINAKSSEIDGLTVTGLTLQATSLMGLLAVNSIQELVVGELCATGRKDGIAVVLLSQDFDAICECSAGAQIMQNMVYKITGRITNTGVVAAQKYLGYDPRLISQNATEAFLPRVSDLYSCWLVEKGGRFWRTRFYPAEMMLASVANNLQEKEARDRLFAQYPSTLKGRLQALKQFTQDYVAALKDGKGFDSIGRSDSETASPPSASTPDTTPSKTLVTYR